MATYITVHGETPVVCSIQDCRPNYSINLTLRRADEADVTIMGATDHDCRAIIEACLEVMRIRSVDPKEEG